MQLCLFNLGAALRDIRVARGFDLRGVAEQTGNLISYAELSKLERGLVDPSLSKIVALAQLYHVSVDDLLRWVTR